MSSYRCGPNNLGQGSPAHAGIDPIFGHVWAELRSGSPAHAGIDPPGPLACEGMSRLTGSPAHAGIDPFDLQPESAG